MLYLLADDNIPDGLSDVLIWPIALTLGAGIIFYVFWRIQKRREHFPPLKWLAVLPLIAGMWIGWVNYLGRWLGNPIYQALVATGREKKMMAAHWGAFLIPFLGLVAIILFSLYSDRLELGLDDD